MLAQYARGDTNSFRLPATLEWTTFQNGTTSDSQFESGLRRTRAAVRTFCKGGIIPLVIGAYGETNDEFQDLLKVCARMAVARGDAVYNSPIFETEVKGGAYSVTLHLYRRALAGVIARGLSLHKRSRLHFVRGSREEAARVSEEAKSHFETGRCSEGNGFSARHSSREYGYYEQFRGFRSGSERPYQ